MHGKNVEVGEWLWHIAETETERCGEMSNPISLPAEVGDETTNAI